MDESAPRVLGAQGASLMELRDYQNAAVEACRTDLALHRSVLVVMATGLGKTVVMIDMVRRCLDKGGRCMIVAHRDELIRQPAQRIQTSLGVVPGIEKANEKSQPEDKVVIASIQTLTASVLDTNRFEKFRPEEWDLILIDEAHHAVSQSYLKFVRYMQKGNDKIRIVGETATPDRGDKVGMHNVFDKCSYEYSMLDGIEDGWLVPVKQVFVTVGTLDYSQIKTVAGELCGKELAEVLEEEKNLHGMVWPTIEMVGDRTTIIFSATVRQAELICEIINRHKKGSAEWICGKTPMDQRRDILARFASGQIQFVVNAQVLTEGYDNSLVSAIVQMSPTLTRANYVQKVGRGTRPSILPNNSQTASDRRRMIADSTKPDLMVIDFKGNAGRHKLVTTFDVLAGKDVGSIADRAAKESPSGVLLDPIEEVKLQEAREQLAEEAKQAREKEKLRRAEIKLKSKYTSRPISPFQDMGYTPTAAPQAKEMCSDKQRTFLMNQGVDPAGLTRKQAGRLIADVMVRRKMGRASLKQEALLKKYGMPHDVTAAEAKRMIQEIADNGWQTPVG